MDRLPTWPQRATGESSKDEKHLPDASFRAERDESLKMSGFIRGGSNTLARAT